MQPKIFFSPSTGGFYLEGVSSSIPDDATAITARRHAELLAHGGEHIVACAKTGKPLCAAPKVTVAQHRAALGQAVRKEASRRIKSVSPLWRQINDLRHPTAEGSTRFARIDAIREASGLIETQLAETPAASLDSFPISTNPLWPEL